MTELAHRADGGGGTREFKESQVDRDGKGRFARQEGRAKTRKELRKFIKLSKREMAKLSDKEFEKEARSIVLTAVMENIGTYRKLVREAADASGAKFNDFYDDPPHPVVNSLMKTVNARSASTLTSASGKVRLEAYYDFKNDQFAGRAKK